MSVMLPSPPLHPAGLRSASGCAPLVLVVEDDASFRELVVETLREMGCFTEAHADALQLNRRLLESGAPDLLITDVRLPGIDGLDAIESLRKLGFLVPTFVMTAFPSDEVRVRMHNLGVAWVFEKPFDPEDLVYMVSKLFEPHSQGTKS